MGKKRAYSQFKPQGFETNGGDHIRYMRLFEDMIYHPKFMELSSSAKVTYMILKMQWKGDSYSGSSVVCPYNEFNRFGLANRTVGRAIKELEASGFIKTERGTVQTAKNDFLKRQPNLYTFTDDWKKDTS